VLRDHAARRYFRYSPFAVISDEGGTVNPFGR
jgi:hypothetical protein